MMIVRPYVLTWENIKEESLEAVITIPRYSQILSFETSDQELIVNVLIDRDQTELHTVPIKLVQNGIDVSDLYDSKLIFNQTVRFNNKSYHIFCNEYI
ncbi:hypothetical protein [Brevibacillus laterosporus]|uniref:Uncharacterized protein n=1 Tax=Brevibacillus laterosporus TaxID=1465 RepID=A0AAP8QHZ6_BRELA|nr:hypothetical protein [Brevibacillus laterosporus]PPB12954.1 hypothetical protein C4A77_00785 [Brevibacillus laterosporus]